MKWNYKISLFFVPESHFSFMLSLNVFLNSSLTWHSNSLPWIYATKTRQALELILNFASPRNRPGRRGWMGLNNSPYKEERGRWWENVSSWTCCYCSLPGDREMKDGVWSLVLEGAPLPPLPSTVHQPTHQGDTKCLCKAPVIINHGRGEVLMFGVFFPLSAFLRSCLHCPWANQSSIGAS